MTADTLTLRLDGEVSLSAFMEAMESFHDLVNALSEDVTPSAEIIWVVTGLEAGSARATVRGQARINDESDNIERVVRAYEVVGKALQADNIIPYSPRIQKHAYRLANVLNGHITALHLQTSDEDAVIVRRSIAEPPKPLASYGIVDGRVLSIMSRHQLSFALYDTIYDRAVTCYVQRGREDELRRAWSKRASVEGMISRDPITGRPEAVHNVGTITVLDDEPRGRFEDARGVAPPPVDAPLPEEAIRRARDAW